MENRSLAASTKPRLEWVDRARGFGIVLVVVGHVLGGLAASGVVADAGAVRWAIRWIYAFHMPLFFFLAGLFASEGGSLRSSIANKVRTIAYPYVLWATLQTQLHAQAGSLANQGNHPGVLAIVWQPPMQFWFLYVLFLLSIGYVALRRMGCGPTACVAIGFGLEIVAHQIGLGSWGVMYLTTRYAPYFTIGAALTPTFVELWLDRTSRWLWFIATACFLVLGACALGDTDNPLLMPLLATVGIAGTIASAARVPSKRISSALVLLGRQSLPIYLAHPIFVAAARIVLLRGLHVDSSIVHFTAGVVVGVAAPLLIARVCDAISFPYLFRIPRRVDVRPSGLEPAAGIAFPVYRRLSS